MSELPAPTPPSVQMEHIHTWIREGRLPVSPKALDALDSPPTSASPYHRPVLELHLPDFAATVAFYAGLLPTLLPVYNALSKRRLGIPQNNLKDHVSLVDGAEYQPGLRWTLIDMMAHWSPGMSRRANQPAAVQTPRSPGIGVLAMAAHDQDLFRQILAGDPRLPTGVFAPGIRYRAQTVGANGWNFVLALYMNSNSLVLGGYPTTSEEPFFAIPEYI